MQRNRDGDQPSGAYWSIAKNRNGPTGKLKLDWHAERTLFTCPDVPEGGYDEFGAFA